MKFTPLPGWLICVPETDEDRAGRIWFPDNMRRKRVTVRCLIHNPRLEELTLDGRRLVVEKWAWKPFALLAKPLYLIPEYAVLAIIEEDDMTGQDVLDDMKNELEVQIKDAVGGDLTKELGPEEKTKLAQDVVVDVESTLESLEEAEQEDEQEEAEEEEREDAIAQAERAEKVE